MVPVSHVIYGLHLTANVALPGLPILRDENKGIAVRLRLKEPLPFALEPQVPIKFVYPSRTVDAHDQPSLRVGLLRGGEYALVFKDGARFVVDCQGRDIWADWPEDYNLEDACTYLFGPVMGLVLRLRGATCLHASAVAVGDHAIALSGFQGAGKSTTAAAFAQLGVPVLADDLVALTEVDGSFLVQPGYPRVNLWPESASALFGSRHALPRITPTWDKCYLALGQNGYTFGSNPLPLAAVYLLCDRQGKSAAIVEEFGGNEAFMSLVANTHGNYLLDRSMRTREFEALGRLVSRVPIRRVWPADDPSAVRNLCESIAADAIRLTAHEGPLAAARSL